MELNMAIKALGSNKATEQFCIFLFDFQCRPI